MRRKPRARPPLRTWVSYTEVDPIVLHHLLRLNAALLPPLLLLQHRDVLDIGLLPDAGQGLVLAICQLEQLGGVSGLVVTVEPLDKCHTKCRSCRCTDECSSDGAHLVSPNQS